MSLLLNLALFMTAAFFILKTTEVFVRGAVDIADFFRLSRVFVGATIVSLVTTAPEFVVSVMSSYMGESGVAVGNAIGSVICNIGIVFASGIILSKVYVKKSDFIFKISFLLLASFLMMLFVSNGVLDKKESFILLGLLIIFMGLNVYIAAKERGPSPEAEKTATEHASLKKGWTLFFLGGAGTVLLARFGLLTPGLAIAEALGIPPIVIGLSLMAVGTSFPELFTAIISAKKGYSEIALGNVIGANILNLLFVLGVSAWVRPLSVDTQTIHIHVPVMILFVLVMFVIGLWKSVYGRREGFVFMGMYFAYMTALFFVLYR